MVGLPRRQRKFTPEQVQVLYLEFEAATPSHEIAKKMERDVRTIQNYRRLWRRDVRGHVPDPTKVMVPKQGARIPAPITLPRLRYMENSLDDKVSSST